MALALENTPLIPTTYEPIVPRVKPRIGLRLVLIPLFLVPFVYFSPFQPPPPIVSTLSQPVQTPPASLRSQTFLVLGDWGRKGKHGQTAVANALGQTVDSLNSSYAQYIISTGDNFYSKGVKSVHDKNFNKSFANVYTHSALKELPWYTVLGNHDHLGNVDAQLEFSKKDERWNMPARYYRRWFGDGGMLMVVFLDTNPLVLEEMSKETFENTEQIIWLKRVLEEVGNGYLLVVGHHNMYTMSSGGHLGSKNLRDYLEPVLMKYSKQMLGYVSGHEHSLMHLQPKVGMDHFISGAGSKVDGIKIPRRHEGGKWRECCGVLRMEGEIENEGKTVWGKSVHGFFRFSFDGTTFTAEGIDSKARVIYEYSKVVVSLI